ncbi:hypothetical protein KY290_036233 [Solanum tuberosum]|uniref:DUF4371 domain-containing protein n=1 Tax=Solanum tuberosum TaxID=4113 RepID=A0ABQ7TTM2_SOLTU|nr:hypothetical protein KY290_036233 [Solanum tuberosum]
MRQEQSIQAAFVKLSNQIKLEHKIRLKASIEVVKLLLNQGLTFRGHRKDESSLNKVGGYFKRMDELRESQAKSVQEAVDMGEVESGTRLNQELDLARAVNTRGQSKARLDCFEVSRVNHEGLNM